MSQPHPKSDCSTHVMQKSGGMRTYKWIYSTLVRTILSYSATVWVRALDNNHNLKKLGRVQALALRIMAGAFPSTHFNSGNHLTETIGCYLKREAAKGEARLQGYNYWTVEMAPSVKARVLLKLTVTSTVS